MSGPAAHDTSSSYAPQPRYPARQDSWTRDYEEVVEFPGQFHERDRMLPAQPPTPSSSLPTFQAKQQHTLGIPSSTSHPARLSPPGIMSSVDQHPAPAAPANNNNAPARPTYSSPLNPSSSAPSTPGLPQPSSSFLGGRPGSRSSLYAAGTTSTATQQGTFSRIANEELRALTGPYPNAITPGSGTQGSRGSMILYRRADSFAGGSPVGEDGALSQQQQSGGYFMQPPPPLQGVGGGGSNRGSMYSVSGDSIVSLGTGAGDSKYPPSLFAATPRFSNSTPLPGTPLGGPMNTTGVGLRHPINSMYTDPVRGSMFSDNRISIAFSLNYGGSVAGGGRGLVAYAYDPEEDDDSEDDEDDWLHDPEVAYPKPSAFASGKNVPPPPPRPPRNTMKSTASGSSSGGHSSASTTAEIKGKLPAHPPLRTSQPTPPKPQGPKKPLRVPHPSTVPKNFRGTASWSWRGIINITTLIAMIGALLCLFMVYPMIRNRMDEGVNARITGNTRINATGQAVEGPPGNNNDGDTTTKSSSVLNPQGAVERRAVETAAASPALLDLIAPSSPSPSPSSASMEIPVEWYHPGKPAPAAPSVASVTGVKGVVYRVAPSSTSGSIKAWPTHVPIAPLEHKETSEGENAKDVVMKEGQAVLGERKETKKPCKGMEGPTP